MLIDWSSRGVEAGTTKECRDSKRHRVIKEDMQLEEIEKIANGKGLIFLIIGYL